MRDLISVGETMVAFCPVDGTLEGATQFRADTAGGESNVAANLAGLGHKVAWASRLGDDAPGRRVLTELQVRGVDVSLVQTDPLRPTGVMLKNPSPAGTKVTYYRSQSAAAAMDTGFLDVEELRQTRIVHSTGVTAALSGSCRAMLDTLIEDARRADSVFSFDVNYRPALWCDADAPLTLRMLASRSDVVFVGRDEAEALWSTQSPDDIRKFLPEPKVVVVKDAEVGATIFERDRNPIFVPSQPVEVVEPVGAGDAFAAGFLSGFLRGSDRRTALELGHRAAAQVLTSTSDLPPLPQQRSGVSGVNERHQ